MTNAEMIQIVFPFVLGVKISDLTVNGGRPFLQQAL